MAMYYNEKVIGKFKEALKVAKRNVKGSNVKISSGNRKMGQVASVSTLPFITCPSRCKGTCGNDCYAAKIANLYKNVCESYANNTALAMMDPDRYWSDIRKAVKGVRFFRFHVSGDILNGEYFREMVTTAKDNPHCEFLCFTKRYEIVNRFCDGNGGRAAVPENLHVLFSGWNNLKPINPYGFPETTVYTKDDDFNENWLSCGGNCFECGCAGLGCWKASDGDIIAFKKH